MDDNNQTLQERAADDILQHVLYQPPEVLSELWKTLESAPEKWPPKVWHWLLCTDPNFWNKHLPPPPPDNQ